MHIRPLLAALGAALPLVAQVPPPRPARPVRPAPEARPAPTPRPAIAPRVSGTPGFHFEFDDARMAREARESFEAHRFQFEDMQWRIREDIESQRWNFEFDHARIAEEARAAIAATPMPPMPPMEPFHYEWSVLTPTPMPGVHFDFDSRIAINPRPAWARSDQGDSLYRRARELLNNGEYRRAAASFRDLSTRTPNSTYAADALYWQAFALYRIGGTEELRTALEALEQQKTRYPGARMQNESEALGVRIRGALASRGDQASAAAIRTTAADSMLRCDREDQQVRAEALNAVTQSDPAGAMPLLQKTLARRDDCSAGLRRTAVFLIGSKGGDAATPTLTQVARTDPHVEVRAAAIDWLARSGTDNALTTLEELSRDTSDRIARSAMRALVNHPSPRARAQVRTIVERSETPERLRLEALSAFDKERSTTEDVTWMRTLYTRTENPRIKARLVNTLSNIGGPEVDQWLLQLARDQEADSDTRRNALRRVGRTLPIADLSRLYDASAERNVRDGVIDILRERPEAEATDKLIDIVKRGTDPQLRSRAISALTSKKDPRTIRLLMEIIDK